MSYCNKDITADSILYNMIDLTFTLASCEMTCNRYYGCDTAALMQNRLQEIESIDNE